MGKNNEDIDIKHELSDIWSTFEIVREALSSNGLEIAVITSILVDKGIITQEEYAEKRVQVSKEIIEYVQEKIKEESKEPKVTIQ
jgi:predicted transporter